MREGKLTLITPVMTSTEGRCQIHGDIIRELDELGDPDSGIRPQFVSGDVRATQDIHNFGIHAETLQRLHQ